MRSRRDSRHSRRPGRRPRAAVAAAAVAALVLAAPLAPGAGAGGAAADANALLRQVRKDTEWLAGRRSRAVGSEGHDRAVGELLAAIRALPGAHDWTDDPERRRAAREQARASAGAEPVWIWTDSFGVTVPAVSARGGTRQATLTVSDGPAAGTHAVWPIWPASVRLNTTPAGGISGRLVYVKEGRRRDLPARSLRGQIGVMEMTGGAQWQEVWNMGASAVVLLGSPAELATDAASHMTGLPICVPRFYVPDGPLADAIRQGKARQGRLDVACRWRRATGTNVWVLVGPRGRASPRPAIAVAAPLDAMSIAIGLAPGAETAVDAAMVLNLLRHYASSRPARPVVFAFVDAFAINQRGLRELLLALAVEDSESQVQAFREEDADRVEEYREHEALAASVGEHGERLRKLTGGAYDALHRYVKDEVAREVVAIETVMHPMRLRLPSLAGAERDRLAKEVSRLAARRSEFFAAQRHVLSGTPVAPPIARLARTLWQRARRRVRVQLAEAQSDLAALDKRRRLRDQLLGELGLFGQQQRPLEFLLGLDLSDSGVAAGLLSYCRYYNIPETNNVQRFRQWLSHVVRTEGESLWPGRLKPAVSLRPLLGTEAPDSFSVGETATVTGLAQCFGLPAATWATLDAARARLDTPQDRAERLDWSRLGPQIEATFRLVDRMVTRTDFTVPARSGPKWNRVTGVIVDTSPGEPVPRLPMPGYLTTLIKGKVEGSRAKPRWTAIVPGIRRQEFARTGVDGRFRFDGLYVHPTSAWHSEYYVQSYALGERGEIVRALDLRKSGRGVRLNAKLQSKDLTPLRAVAFTCREVSAVRLFDPRFLQNLPGGTLFDARRGTEPQRVNTTIYQGQLACQVEPGVRWQLVLRAGIARNRMALLNMMDPDDPAAAGLSVRRMIRGFLPGERLPLPPAQMAARDLYRLDKKRLRDYRRAGITSDPIEALQRRTERLLDECDAADRADDGAAVLRSAAAALSNEVRAYQAVRDTADDVIRGAIFLLLALVPFSFAMERLLFSTPRIYRQLAAMFVLFAVMTAVLWSFHPAFRISSQPLMIIMAFAILFMSLLVLSVVYSKFESGLAEVRSGRAEASGAQTSRMGVLVTAVRLGIANMRRRKLRTALTGIAVVLITFSLLCFMSTSTYRGQKQLSLAVEAAYTGVLIRQPSRRPMTEEAREQLANIVGDEDLLAVRTWWSNPWKPDWRLHVRNPRTGRQVSLQAALGVAANEPKFTRLDRVCADWARFAASQRGCYLAKSVAEELGVRAGETVVIAGRDVAHEMTLIAAYDSAAVDRMAIDLDGESVLPSDFSALSDEELQVVRNTALDVVVEAMAGGAGLTSETYMPPLSSASVAIVPERMLRGLRDTSIRSMAVLADGPAAAEALARELTGRLAFPIYYGFPGAVRAIASTPLLPRAPKALIIPLLIGGLMIFNTMLSSIAERRREVYIYTSLGLAPLHVGVLFLAEAVTYGLMGAVFGYVVGQGVATALGQLGWMGGLTLNYSGTQAVAVMLMVLAVVVLSSLVPAYLAGRLAAPSTERSWRVPEPKGNLIHDVLPFTVTPQTAGGVVMFLLEYLDAHREGTIGHFTTDALRAFRERTDGLEAVGIAGTVWLAPYDLGVRQDVRLTIRPAGADGVYGIHIELERHSGQMRSWRGLNRTFLGDLRRQLLGWRRLKMQRILEYIAEGREMLEKAPTGEA